MTEQDLQRKTSAVCPTCLQIIPAEIVASNGAVYLQKHCAAHGRFELMVWPDVRHYNWTNSFQFPTAPPRTATTAEEGCPRDCGPCPHHLRKPTLIEIEVTRRCNLHCPVCFMAAEKTDQGPELGALEQIFQNIRDQVGLTPGIQLTGGEPTIRRDLPEIIRVGRKAGFAGIEVNTNGVVISKDLDFLQELQDAGLTGVYLQFDGLSPRVYRQLRGADLLQTKLDAIENCRKVGLQIVLAMTIVDRVNRYELGDVLRYALRNINIVTGLALQPAFTSGRFEVGASQRLSMGDIIFELASQSSGMLSAYDFYPLGCSHPLCSCGAYLVEKGERNFVSFSRTLTPDQYADAFDPASPQGSVLRDIAARSGGDQGNGLSVVIMNYMDTATMQLDRLRECSMMVATPDGRMVPFCSYHLTGSDSQRIHSPFLRERTLAGVLQ